MPAARTTAILVMQCVLFTTFLPLAPQIAKTPSCARLFRDAGGGFWLFRTHLLTKAQFADSIKAKEEI
jgi:hypothetical protein